jgi:AraC-like DNA-binding protein
MENALPLASSVKFRSHDLRESRDYVGEVFCSHKITLEGSAGDLSTRLHEASFGRSSLAYTQYGAAVSIETGNLSDIFLVQVPWSGEIEVTSGNHSGVFHPGTASVVSPSHSMRMRWSKDSGFYTVKLCRDAVETRLGKLLGTALGKPLVFDPVLDFSSPEGRRWCSAVDFVRQQSEWPLAGPTKSPLEQQLEDTLCLMLIELLQHNYSDQLHDIATMVAPKTVKRACQYIRDNVRNTITLDKLAAATAVSPATLAKHFRRYTGRSPMHVVRDEKLQAVHDELQHSSPGVNVAEIALMYGFNHLGRFSAYYRERYNQLPSYTLKTGASG